MILNILVVLVIVACAGFMLQEGVYSAAIILICTVLGGLIAFNFYEPVSEFIRGNLTFLGRYSDFITMMLLFSGSVTALRLASEYVAPVMVQLPDLIHRGGGIVVGVWLGWVLSGILICGMQMLPLHKKFLGYDYRLKETKANGFNADRYWLAFVHRVGQKVFDKNSPQSFDPNASFVIKYYNLRYSDAGFESLGATEVDADRDARSRGARGRRRT